MGPYILLNSMPLAPRLPAEHFICSEIAQQNTTLGTKPQFNPWDRGNPCVPCNKPPYKFEAAPNETPNKSPRNKQPKNRPSRPLCVLPSKSYWWWQAVPPNSDELRRVVAHVSPQRHQVVAVLRGRRGRSGKEHHQDGHQGRSHEEAAHEIAGGGEALHGHGRQPSPTGQDPTTVVQPVLHPDDNSGCPV